MATANSRILYWAPRVLAIAYILFLSAFALDVFGEEHGFWKIVGALCVHLIPSFVLVVALVLAWKWEWVGALFYFAAGTAYIVWVVPRPVSAALKEIWILAIALPAFVVAGLFLANWRRHGELRAKHL